jgi:hypothetical protein
MEIKYFEGYRSIYVFIVYKTKPLVKIKKFELKVTKEVKRWLKGSNEIESMS